jgi:hypothetical protein
MNCKATLPSAECAFDLFDKPSPKTVAGVVVTTAFRASLIAAGAYVAGVRDPKVLALAAFGGAASVEVFVLGWVYMQKRGIVT